MVTLWFLRKFEHNPPNSLFACCSLSSHIYSSVSTEEIVMNVAAVWLVALGILICYAAWRTYFCSLVGTLVRQSQ